MTRVATSLATRALSFFADKLSLAMTSHMRMRERVLRTRMKLGLLHQLPRERGCALNHIPTVEVIFGLPGTA